MRILLFVFLVVVMHLSLSAQCTYLAYDGFNYSTNQALQGLSGGTGWQAPWNTQNNNSSVPGYQTQGSLSLNYPGLTSLGIYGQGGSQYLTTGRRINTSSQGPFANYIAENSDVIGSESGDTLWMSVLFNKLSNDDQEVWLDLHDNNIAWCSGCSGQHIGMGYFGSNSNVSGQRRWTMRVGNNYFPSDSVVSINDITLLVVQIIFTPGNTQLSFFVNPPLGYTGPGPATLLQNMGAAASIRSAAVYLGNNANSAAIDELRFAASYPCVAPDNNVAVNLPPTAAIVANPIIGQRPLTVNFNANTSTDPEGGNLTYQWNFGDGTANQNGVVVNHTFTALGELTTSLLVTDPLGLQHTAYQTITVTDENGRFPCQTSITSLQMASCNQNNGQIRINTQNTNFSLRNQGGSTLPVTNGNEYHQLSQGQYTLIVNGNNNTCYDSMTLHVIIDSTSCQGWQPASCAMQIGTNLGGFSDWSVERPLKNLLKHVRSEILTYEDNCFCWNSNVLDEISLDPQGYPTHAPQNTSAGLSKLRYVISADGGNFRRDSSYLFLYEGVGSISFGGAISISSSTPGRIAFTALDNGNVNFNIEYSDPLNHVRNIRIVRPQHEFTDLQQDAFYEVFKEKISPFQTLRFMDWGNTNGNTNVTWADRAKTDYFTYSGPRGVPYEIMIQLCNELDKDAWICVPHMADSTYVANMAQLFLDSLDDHLNIYLEYSNEVWNWIFPQAHYNNDNRPGNLNYGRAMAEKAGKTFAIWHNVFGDQACRVKRVLGIQAGFSYLNEQILSQLPPDAWDYGSPTHYFGLDHGSTGNPRLDLLGSNATVQDVLNNALNGWDAFRPLVKLDYRNIQVYGKKIITYEGGQHFVGNSFGIPYPYQQAMWDAQNASGMYDIYDRMHDSIRSWGCQLATNFSLATVQESVYGSWGVLSDIEVQPPYSSTAKKYQAVLDNAPDPNCEYQITWQGATNSLWSNPCNWDKTRQPQPTDQVTIPANTLHSPQLDIHSTVRSIQAALNASLEILSGFVLRVVP